MWVNLINNSVKSCRTQIVKKLFYFIEKVIRDPCIVTNDKFNILEINSECEILSGYKKGELEGKNIRILMMDYYSKFYDELFNRKKSDKIIRKILISNKTSKKIPVTVTISDYIIDELFKRVYIFTFKSVENDNNIKIDLVDSKPNSYIAELFQIINEQEDKYKKLIMEQSEKSKKLIMEHYAKMDQVVQCYEEKIIVMEEEYKNLIKSNKDLIKNIRELQNNLNYYKRKSGQATLLNVLSQDISRIALKDFCNQNRTEENLLFWEDVNKFKTKYLSNSSLVDGEITDDLRQDIINIYNKYIAIDSSYQLNINDKMREDIKYHLENEIDLYNIFDKALYDVLQLLNTDVYPIFCSTSAGRKAISLFN